MAGTDAGFDATEFRDAIRFAMRMGAPEDPSERATFRWTKQQTFAVADVGGSTYDWSATPASTTQHPDVQVDVAVEFSARPAATRDEAAGQFDESRVTLTLLDEDYANVRGASEVILGGNTYNIDFVGPPMGLFEVTVYSVFCTARDES
jgi:hypothetical protein